jgi:hypothetical protein
MLNQDFSGTLLPAIKFHHDEIFEKLLEKDHELFSLRFEEILFSRNYPVLRTFFMHRFDSSKLPNGVTVLHYAAASRQHSLGKLSASPIECNRRNPFSSMPLFFAV